jgi:hypothetical protein
VHTPNLYFFVAIGVFFSALILVCAIYYRRHRRPSPASFEDLFSQLKWIDRNNIAQVALELVDASGLPRPRAETATLEPAQLWDLIGGLEGLEIMERNSDVLIELAFYIQRWYPEAVAVAERLRLDARGLKFYVGRLRGAEQKGNLQISFPFYARRAVVSYYRMTRQLLALYEATDLSRLADLQRTL